MVKFLNKFKKNKKKFENIKQILLDEFMKFVDCICITREVESEYIYKIKNAGSFENLIKKYILEILSTNSGRILICSLLHLMMNKGEKITFKIVNDGDGISINTEKIYIDLSHLFSSTGFYVCDASGRIVAETAVRPDVYLFHELLHYKHYLEDDIMHGELSRGIINIGICKFNKDLSDFGEDFPRSIIRLEAKESEIADDVDYEEMRTIIGVPFEKDSMIICENSYRYEKGYKARYNLLDAESEPVSTKNHKKITTIINNLKSY